MYGRNGCFARAALTITALLIGGSQDGLRAQAVDASSETQAAAESGRDALRHAGEVLAGAKGKKGDERKQVLEQAARAFRAVIADHDGDTRTCAEAWWELAEILRREEQLPDAESAYGQALALDETRYAERALLQQAHMQRRLKRWDDALATYRKAATIKPGSARSHEARCWIGKCLLANDDVPGAIAAYEQALEQTEKPMRIIELCNLLAKAQLRAGDLAAAEAAIARAEDVVPEGDGEDVERVRRAVDGMSARRALQRARDHTGRAAEDAADVEDELDGGGR